MEVVLHESYRDISNVKTDVFSQDKFNAARSSNEKCSTKAISCNSAIDIKFEKVSFTASYRKKYGNVPAFLNKPGEWYFLKIKTKICIIILYFL